MITPLEIENKKFSKQMMNGYSVEEVDDFLDELTACYEKLYKESNENQDKIAELNGKLEHYKQIEGTLNNTLIMAQSTAEDIKNVAKQQADQIIKDAESDAKQSLASLEQQILLKKKDFDYSKVHKIHLLHFLTFHPGWWIQFVYSIPGL